MDYARREVLAGLVGVLGGGYWYTTQDDVIGGTGGHTRSVDTRFSDLHPLPGGIGITVPDLDGYGTLSGGVVGQDDDELYFATNRHVIDPDYPDSDEDDVIGTDVQYAGSNTTFGGVVDVGPSKGTHATDWALIAVEQSEWTTDVLGLPDIAGQGSVETGDRIIMSGARTGLIGGEITSTRVDVFWRGTNITDAIEYRVSDDTDTAGNSGSWVGQLTEDGFEVVGIHSFTVDGYEYAIPVEDVLDGGDVQLSSDGGDTSLADADADAYVEGAVSNDGQIVVANIGASSVVDRGIRVKQDGETQEQHIVSLDPLEWQVLETDVDPHYTLDTGDVERSTEWDDE